MNTPLFFYKFVPFERKDILQKGFIRLTPAKDFNDPFELVPTITPLSSKWIEYILSVNENKKLKFNDDDYEYSYKRSEDLEIKKQLLNNKINKIGILSLSSNNSINQLLTVAVPEKDDPRTNLIMWSHYADSHKGFVIEFKANFIENIDIKKVEYSNERDIITFEDIESNTLNKLFFKKSLEWSYEQEYRAIFELSQADKIINDIHLFQIDKSKINSITFGCNMSDKNKKTIIDIVNDDNSFSNVNFNHAYLNNEGYFLNFYSDNGKCTNNPELGIKRIPIQKNL